MDQILASLNHEIRTARGNSAFDICACAPYIAKTQQCATGEPSNPRPHILRSHLDDFRLRGNGSETPTARLDKTAPISTSSPPVSNEGRISITGLIIPRLPIVPACKSLPLCAVSQTPSLEIGSSNGQRSVLDLHDRTVIDRDRPIPVVR
jgi:hypothetical protein